MLNYNKIKSGGKVRRSQIVFRDWNEKPPASAGGKTNLI